MMKGSTSKKTKVSVNKYPTYIHTYIHIFILSYTAEIADQVELDEEEVEGVEEIDGQAAYLHCPLSCVYTYIHTYIHFH